MSGRGSADSNANVGRGRGNLLALLREASSATESSSNVTPDSGVQTNTVLKSHFALRTPATPTLGGAGRAKLLAALKDVSTALRAVRLPSQFENVHLEASPVQTVSSSGVHIRTMASSQASKTESEQLEVQSVVSKTGTHGTRVDCFTNYIRLRCDPRMGVFEYEVRFKPDIHAIQLRYKLLAQHREKLFGDSPKTFDGVTLYLPYRLTEAVINVVSQNPNDDTPVNVSIIYKRQKKVVDCLHLYNVLFDRIMKQLEFVRHGRKQFDPTEPKMIAQHKLEVWPGYVTAVDEYEDGIMLCCDVAHRVLSQATVLEMMTHAHRSARGNIAQFRNDVIQALLGAIVMTRYNNKTYRIDDIDFDLNPTSTFRARDRDISFVEYYKCQYGIDIGDLKQPLLVSRVERRVQDKAETETLTFNIVPELAFLTGLTDAHRADFKVMRDVATYTRITPNQRALALDKFCKRVNKEPATRALLAGWGLTLEDRPILLQARQLGVEQVIFGNNRTVTAGQNADFGKYATNNQLLHVIDLTDWLVVHTGNNTKQARAFMDCMERNSRPMGIRVCIPKTVVLDNDQTDSYIAALRRSITTQTQIVVCICPTSRDDRYAAIKKVCCAEMPIPSQVINAKTLSNDDKNRAIVQKIALQMNCKMGGTLWSIKIPFVKVMICGIDTYHEVGGRGNSVSAFVASLNATYTRWYSKAVLQSKKEELMHGLVDSFHKALTAYRNMNNSLPVRIIIYRDGVGDGQLKMCKEYELEQLKAACAYMDMDYSPEFLFIVVQKRINTRIFAQKGPDDLVNPNPGLILDHTITRRNMYDFFLIPQSVRQGTVMPTHLIVVHDDTNLSPDIVQRLSYKLCFLYYNWPGTIRVPACCQYAHKLAFLVGQSIKRETSEKLADKLFYL